MTNLQIAGTSPALAFQAPEYPAHYKGRVPLIVQTTCRVQSNGIVALAHGRVLSVAEGSEHYCFVNSFGAVSAIVEEGQQLGLIPSEFFVVQWHLDNGISWPNSVSGPEFPHTERAESRGFYE